MKMWRLAAATLLACLALPSVALAWGGHGHRAVAAIAARLLPADRYQRMNAVMAKLEKDKNFIDGASYPDEYVRSVDPSKDPWHFADLPDGAATFHCGQCLFYALDRNLAIIRQGNHDYKEAVALAWVIHLVGDMHQPLHMTGRDGGGNGFAVTYRHGQGAQCKPKLHAVWDNCLVDEAANGMTPKQLADSLVGPLTTYQGRSEIGPLGTTFSPLATPWLAWGRNIHVISNDVAYGHLSANDDLGDGYIVGQGKALETAKRQMLVAGIRLAYLLDQNFQ